MSTEQNLEGEKIIKLFEEKCTGENFRAMLKSHSFKEIIRPNLQMFNVKLKPYER